MKHYFCAIFVAGALAACAPSARPELANAIKAIVHDSVITYDEVEELSLPAAQLLYRQYQNQPEMFQNKLSEVRSNNLEQLVARQLIIHEFKTAYNVPESILDKDVDKEIQDRIHSKYGDRMRLTKTLQAEGMTFEKYRQHIREDFILMALRQKNISSEIILSPHKVEAYYLAHRDEFKMEDEVKLRMIVLNKSVEANAPDAKRLAEEIQAKLKDGATFSEMAKVNSQDLAHAKEGGDWGWFETAKLRKELSEAASHLKAGESSGVIETPESCYLMLVEEKRPAHFKPLSEVRDQIEKNLLLDERRRLEEQWIARLKKKTFVRYF